MRAASFCSGVGGIDLGLARVGIESVWSCERDPFARAIHEVRFGRPVDSDDLETADPPDVDLWHGGIPCQDVSSAGRRAGLAAGTRSGLVWSYLRLARERRPRWVLYENVPGLLSVHGGRDFAELLAGFEAAGYYVAWRVFDARHFGVPQRRRRIFLLARAREGALSVPPWDVLDVPDRFQKPGTKKVKLVDPVRLDGRPAHSWAPAGWSGDGWVSEGRMDEFLPEAVRPSSLREILETDVDARYDLSPKACAGILVRAERRGRKLPDLLERALRSAASGEAVDIGNPDDVPFPETANPLTLRAHTISQREAANNLVVRGSFNSTAESGRGGNGWEERVAPPIRVGSGVGIASPPAVVLSFDETQITHPESRVRCDPNAPSPALARGARPPTIVYQQHGSDVGPMGALRAGRGDVQSGVPFVVNAAESCAKENHARESDVARCLDSTGAFATNQGGTVVASVALRTREGSGTAEMLEGEVSSLRASQGGGDKSYVLVRTRVRRLTPVECERLQGLPDGWTLVPWKGKPAKDGPRYKCVGNSVAVPVLKAIGRRLAESEGKA